MGLKLDDYMDWPEIEDLEYAECTNPKHVLGPVEVRGDGGYILLRSAVIRYL